MTTLALVAVLAFAQDDMSVYREALFEEVDRGNLEKAMELYGRVAKAAGEPSLRAKALVRGAHCLEKLGKAKEAEKAYRDVLDKHPNAEDATRFARERLAAMDGALAAGLVDGAVSQLILQLGSNDPAKREEARRMLVLRGAVMELRRALEHKDPLLSMNAAYGLVQLEQYEGTYDVFAKRAKKISTGTSEWEGFVRLLATHPPSLKKVIDGDERVEPRLPALVRQHNLAEIRVPAVRDRLAARVLQGDDSYDTAAAWAEIAGPDEMNPFLERALKAGRRNAVSAVLNRFLEDPKRVPLTPEIVSALAVVESADDEWREDALSTLAPWVSPAGFLQILGAWVRTEKHRLQHLWEKAWVLITESGHANRKWQVEVQGLWPAFVIGLVGDERVPEDARRLAAQYAAGRELKPDQAAVLARYFGANLENGKLGELQSMAVAYMAEYLPDDAPELDAAYDRVISAGSSVEEFKSDARRRRYFDAALRAISSPDAEIQSHGLNALEGPHAREHAIRAIPQIGSVHKDNVGHLINRAADAVSGATAKQRAEIAAGIAKVMATGTVEVRQALASTFAFDEPAWREAMNAAMRDDDWQVRQYAVQYWTTHAAKGGRELLLQALSDSNEQVQLDAIRGLGAAPSLDSVPSLIEMLKSPNEGVREHARAALEKIRKHVEEQDQWRKWLEEVKRGEKK